MSLHLPKINSSLIRHFLRGYFDGDGSFTVWTAKETGKKDRIRGKFDICSKTSSLLLEIKRYLEENDITVSLTTLNRDNMYRISTSHKKEIYKIWNLLYKDCTFFLNRKYQKMSDYVNTEISEEIKKSLPS